MILKDLLEGLDYELLSGSEQTEIKELVYDSRKAAAQDVFVCIRGAVRDAHDFAEDVAKQGVAAIVVERDVEPAVKELTMVVKVKDTRYALAVMAAAFFGHPAEKLTTIGVTGTKGKTSATYMIKGILEGTGRKTGLIGTIETIIGETHIPSNNTTPESYLVQSYFARMVEEGCQCVVMEVSSQGLMLHRVSGFTFDYGIFTNISPDHIGPNEHKDFEDYLACKERLFSQCRHGIINADDPYAAQVIAHASCDIETFGITQEADYRAEQIELYREQGSLGISYHLTGKKNFPVRVDIPGRFSVYNSLTAVVLGLHFTDSPEILQDALAKVQVKGRVELVSVSDRYTLMIDYAHNAVSLTSILETIREYQPGRIVTVFGCGGNRDRNRRYEMGEVSARLSDLSIITSDNPRFEKPEAIIDDIVVGVKRGGGKYITIPDRKEAIRYAMQNAQEGDVVILAGKGHEDYQEIEGKKYPMDERVLIQEILEEEKN
ncbi:MAG: UDP-N-acetylmuramoyl-L-alanyl-D-glutamate--2,6-diaminopimelate ligase [Lachnospiraceae bacterium]|nr:UDP-N-acetylmuramoyl-L-alanyl-D-glutamate--2,6-diaminopimelate ligase [Lachnospiraceae bacterium]